MRKELNFRDVGGLETEDNHKVKKGYIYRSRGLYMYTKEDLRELQSYSIRYVLDLRAEEECARHPNPVLATIEDLPYDHIGTKESRGIDFNFLSSYHTVEETRKHYASLIHYYCEMPYHNTMLQVFFDALLEGKVPLIVHCATGKDRTGICIAMVLKVLGVREEEILKDYVRSNEAFEDSLQKCLKDRKDILKENPEYSKAIETSKGVRREILEKVLQTFYERYPDVYAYMFQEYGFTEEQVDQLRKRYVEE